MSLMPLAPNLDDRTFQDLVDEAKRLIPRFCPEWTDHNVSDPGVAMIELFAYLTESMLFRLNRVPERTYIAFLDMIGVRLLPPQAATVDLTFALSAPQPAPVRIPAGTEVATIRTPDWEAVTFSTIDPVTIEPPNLIQLLTSPDGTRFTERRDRIVAEELFFDAFEREPKPGNAWYLGFAADVSRHTVQISVEADLGTGPNPNDTPLTWEGWGGEDAGWLPLEVERDLTYGLLRPGDITLYLPPGLLGATFGDRRARNWLRARVLPTRSGQYPYDRSPRIRSVEAVSIGGTIPARHAERIRGETLGFSDGEPGQVLRLSRTPVLPRRAGQHLEVGDGEGGWVPWLEVPGFAESGPDDPHYRFDPATATIMLGPAVRAPDGTIRQHGAVPPQGTPLRFSSYDMGGGVAGNVGSDRLVVLTSSLAYVARVTNRQPATGGADVETLDHAKLRAGAALRTRDRAVTAADFEVLAVQAAGSVARARALDPPTSGGSRNQRPGTVVVAILPMIASPERSVEADELKPAGELMDDVRAYLDERRLITTRVDVRAARVVRVAVHAAVTSQIPGRIEHVRSQVEAALYRLLNPYTGGPDGGGWPFGRDLSLYDVHAAIQAVPGLGVIEEVRLSVVNERGQARDAGQRVAVPQDGVVASARHTVVVGGPRR
jgi:predicted phage baseplate assembly protein